MASLNPGGAFPRLGLTDGRGNAAAALSGETLYGIFKTTCPTCELAWPFFDRIGRIALGGALAVVAISQDDVTATAAWNRRLAVGLTTLFDEKPWPASNALGIDTVPTFLRVGKDGRLLGTVEGFQRQKMQDFAAEAASLAGQTPAPLFRPGENIPALKAG